MKSPVQAAVFLFCLPSVIANGAPTGPFQKSGQWSGWGGSIFNNRWASQNTVVSSSNIGTLNVHCKLSYLAGVSAAATILGDVAYYPTWNGLFVALNYKNCRVQWQLNVTEIITEYAPISTAQALSTAPVSRTSPQIDGDVLYFGTQTHALLVAVDRHSGKKLGAIQINPHPVAIITMSPTFYDSKIFVGSSSAEESAADFVPDYPCCSFVGNMVALSFSRHSGRFNVEWNVTMLPEPYGVGGWSGGAIWGSQPSIDAARKQLFIATGNIYASPPAFDQCQNSTTQNQTACEPANVWQESVIAMDLDCGKPNWVRQISPLDAWTLACGIPGLIPKDQANCPGTPGPDADFGMAPAFVPGSIEGGASADDVVVVGQKNGNLYSLSAASGQLLWTTVTSPDGTDGGLSWGIAADRGQVYFTAINSQEAEWQIQPSNITINNSAYGAASLKDGTLLWETQAPKNSIAFPPPSVVGDIVIVGRSGGPAPASVAPGTYGGLVVLRKSTGEVIADVDLDAIMYGGITIQDQYILFGSGYNEYKGNASFYVMTVSKDGA